MNIRCKDPLTHEDFDLSGYSIQTWVCFGKNEQYVPFTVAGNIISYKIPAAMSKGSKRGIAETRIFKDDDVFEVLRANITVLPAGKPDTEHHDPTQEE